MSVERFVITRREPYGQIFADGRTYERIEGIAHYAVDTNHAANQVITDLALALTGSIAAACSSRMWFVPSPSIPTAPA